MTRATRASIALISVAVMAAGCSAGSNNRKAALDTKNTAAVTQRQGDQVVVWAVGDGPNPTNNDLSKQVSDMIVADNPAAVLYLGDVYNNGTSDEFKKYYDPTYGRFASITYPTPGNHELGAKPQLSGYDGYWAAKKPAVVGPNNNNLYAADLANGWRVLGLTSSFAMENEQSEDEEDNTPGPQAVDVVNFLNQELAAHTGTCYLPIMHRPRFSAGAHKDQVDLDPIYQLLNGRTALLLQGHEHEYFRLDLAQVQGAASKLPGAQSIVVGTGGVQASKTINAGYQGLAASWVAPSKSAKNDPKYYGALRLTLTSGAASFEFRSLDGKVKDSGSVQCTPVAPAH